MELFNKEDILTVVTTDKAKIGDNGYFGDTLKDIEDSVECGKVCSLVWIDNENQSVYAFKGDFFEDHFALFLPADKVKKSIYRPLKSIDELFSFLMPDLKNQKINKYKKAELLLGKKITLRRKEDNFVKVITINEIGFYDNDDSKDNYLNSYLVDELYHHYKTLIDGKWIPFGIKGE
jgi:hypothetical protein